MKRLVVFILITSILISLSACGSKGNSDNMPTVTENSAELVTPVIDIQEASGTGIEKDQEYVSEEVTEKVTEEDNLVTDMSELEAIGDVEVENGILTVSITMPADLVDDATTQEELDKGAGEYYRNALLNEDGSVTYKMTKEQHRAMLDSITEGFDQTLQEMIDDNQTYSFAGIKHNENYTVFDVTEDSNTVGFTDSFSTFVFYMFSGMYNIFSGNEVENITVNFYGPSGNLIQSSNSADMGN